MRTSGCFCTPSSNKADKNQSLQAGLYAQYAYTLRNPAIDVDDIAIFDNPPLTQMSKLDYHTSNYVASDTIRPKNAPPLASADSHWWQILTFCNSPGRALQIATECFTAGQKNGRMFLRTRHVDNDDFTQWQAWKEVATCYCNEMEWKALPMINGWINAVGDPAAALKYRKGADGKVVYVRGYIKLTGNLTAESNSFAYLPEGYRPTGFWWSTTSHEYKEGALTCRVNPDGKMYITSIGSDVQDIVNWVIPICLTIPI